MQSPSRFFPSAPPQRPSDIAASPGILTHCFLRRKRAARERFSRGCRYGKYARTVRFVALKVCKRMARAFFINNMRGRLVGHVLCEVRCFFLVCVYHFLGELVGSIIYII